MCSSDLFKAAEQGESDAQVNLGLMYKLGKGMMQDDVEAEKWYRKAAEQGSAFAQFKLGMLYQEGEGVPQDYVLAHLWFNLAASRAAPENKKVLTDSRDRIASRMSSAQLAEAQRLAREWKPKVISAIPR